MDNIPQDEIIEFKHNSLKQSFYNKLSYICKIIGFIIIVCYLIYLVNQIKKLKSIITNNLINTLNEKVEYKQKDINILSEEKIYYYHNLLLFESNLSHLSEINKKRTFEKRYPFPKEINCYEHLKEGGLRDIMAFASFLTKNITFFEFGSGCSSIIAKYYANKSYAVEGNKIWYEKGIKNGLKDNIIFKDIKPDGSGDLWSTPGKDSNIKDWKRYFQAYKEEYKADIIFIDGRFRVACAFDIFNKIKEDTLILIHEYFRPQYLIIEKYYDYIYHWDTLYLFKKKLNIKEIPLDFQKLFWNDST